MIPRTPIRSRYAPVRVQNLADDLRLDSRRSQYVPEAGAVRRRLGRMFHDLGRQPIDNGMHIAEGLEIDDAVGSRLLDRRSQLVDWNVQELIERRDAAVAPERVEHGRWHACLLPERPRFLKQHEPFRIDVEPVRDLADDTIVRTLERACSALEVFRNLAFEFRVLRRGAGDPGDAQVDPCPRRRRQDGSGLRDGISVTMRVQLDAETRVSGSGRHGLRVVAQAIPACGVNRALGDDELLELAVAQALDEGLDAGGFRNRSPEPPDDFVLCGAVFGPGVVRFVSASAWRRQRTRDAELNRPGTTVRRHREYVGDNLSLAIEDSQLEIDETRSVGDALAGKRAAEEPRSITFTFRQQARPAAVSAPELDPQAAESSASIGIRQESAHRKRVGRTHQSVSTQPPASYVSRQTASVP